MKILYTPSYCYPERISGSHLEKDKFNAYANSGFELILHVPSPTRGLSKEEYKAYKRHKYEELEKGYIKIHRFSMFRETKNVVLRAIRYFCVNLIQYIKGKAEKDIDLIYGISTPPTQGAMSAMLAQKMSKTQKRRIYFIYELQDVFPDSLVMAGLAKKNSFLYNIGMKIADYTYRNADAIIAISEDIKRNIMEKGVPEEKIHVIYNWIDTNEVHPVAPEDNKLFEELELSRKSFKIIYAGNLGKLQGLDTLLDAADILKDQKDIEFLIFGTGAEEESLKARTQAEEIVNVRFFPLLPMERVSEVYSLGNACVVSCKKGTGAAGVPSKTWSIMACGKTLLVSFDEGSELCRTIEKAEAGLCCPPEDAVALAQNVLELYKNPTKNEMMGNNARKYALDFVDKKAATDKYISVIKSTVKRG